MKRLPFRFFIGVMIFMTTFTNYMLRANMSVSIIGMVNKTEGQNKTHEPICVEQDASKPNKTKKPPIDEQYHWTEDQIGSIIAGYFYGYMISSLPAGAIAELLGPWHSILWTSVGSAVLTVLTPLCIINGSHIGVVVNRALIGLLGGIAYPAVNVLIAKWAPPKEKGKFLAAMMGNTLGSVFSFSIVGLVTSTMGWKWGFYVLGIFMVFYCLAFAILVADTPQKSRWASQEERDHITETQEGHVSDKKSVAPYLKILTSVPFWMLCCAQYGNLWGLNLILTYAPKFMADTLGFDIKSSGGLAALPYLARLFCSQGFGFVGDLMRQKEVITPLTRLRKFFIIFSHFIPALCMFLIPAAGCNAPGVIALMVLNQGFNGAVVVSHLINPQDLAPNFAGSVYGIMNFIGMTTGIFVPTITGAVNTHFNSNLTAAAIIFGLGGAAFTLGGLFFVLFGKAETQPWNEIKDKPPAAAPAPAT